MLLSMPYANSSNSVSTDSFFLLNTSELSVVEEEADGGVSTDEPSCLECCNSCLSSLSLDREPDFNEQDSGGC